MQNNIIKISFIGILVCLLNNILFAQDQISNYPSLGSSNWKECRVAKVIINSNSTKVLLEVNSSKKNDLFSISRWTVLMPYNQNLLRELRELDLDIPPATSTDQTYLNLWQKLVEKRREAQVFAASMFQGRFIKGLEEMELDKEYNLKSKNNEVYDIWLEFGRLQPGVDEIMIIELVENGFEWIKIKVSNPDNTPKTNWNEISLKADWKKSGITTIEGIYENTEGTTNKYKLALKKDNNLKGYQIIYLSGLTDKYWKTGDVKAFLTKTATPNLFKAKWLMQDKSINENLYISFEKGIMKILWTDRKEEDLYLKLYPESTNGNAQELFEEKSGSGFALSEDGYIVTNYHVVEGASNIIVKGINGNLSKSFKAKIIIEDKNNDLVILKITDPEFRSLGKVPYKLFNAVLDVGSDVYTLGYPLRSSMGDEIKLTNGIISSKSGYQGDKTTYQISVPIQPGNSGGPLFDSKGNVIGIICSKHTGAENVSYAIKTSFLMNLLHSLDNEVSLPQINLISAKNLSEQVKYLRPYIYVIEAQF